MPTANLDLKKFSSFVEKRHKPVIALVVAITLVCLFFLPSIQFETNLETFFPDNEVKDSSDRVEDYFGTDPVKQYIDITRKVNISQYDKDNIFAIVALREQYNLTQIVLGHEGVEGVISVALEVENRLQAQNHSLFEPTINYSTIKKALGDSSEGISAATLEYFEYLKNLLLDKYSMKDRNGLVWLISEIGQDEYTDELNAYALRTLIIIDINASIPTKERKELANQIREDVDNTNFKEIEAHHTSADLMAYDVDQASNQSMSLLGILIIFSIIAILWLNFRDGSYVLLCLATLIIAVVWTLASIIFLGMEFTALEIAVVPLIIGMGVDDAVHFSRRYLEERDNARKDDHLVPSKDALKKEEKKDIGESIGITFKSIGMAIFLTSLTTAIAFLSNVSSQVVPVREFGFICALGIIYAFILTVTFHLAVRYWYDSYRLEKGEKDTGVDFFSNKKKKIIDLDAFMGKVADLIDRFPLTVIAVAILITLASVTQFTHIQTEFDVKEFLPPDFDTLETGTIINEKYEGGTFTTAYILVEDDDIAKVSTFHAIENTTLNVFNDEQFANPGKSLPLIDNILLVMDKAIEANDTLREEFGFVEKDVKDLTRKHYVPGENATNQGIRDFLDYLYENNSMMNDIQSQSFRNATRKLIHRDEGGNFTATVIKVTVKTQSNDDARQAHKELKADLQNFTAGQKASVTGYVILIVVTSDTLQESQIQATIVSVILAFIILLFVFKGDWKLSIIGIIPVIFSTIWILAFMVFSSWLHTASDATSFMPLITLNVLTVTVTALSVGLGIDFAIHVIERFREDLALEHTGIKDSIKSTLEHTGSALLISALTTIVGFGVLVFSPMPIVRSYGLITATIIFFSLAASTLILPVFLMYWAVATGNFPEEAERFKISTIVKDLRTFMSHRGMRGQAVRELIKEKEMQNRKKK